MSEPVTGDMREFGFSDSNPAEAEEGAIPGLVEEEPQEAAEAEEEEVEIEASSEEDDSDEEEQEAAEPPSEDDILAQVSDYYSKAQQTQAAAQQPLTQADVDRMLNERLSRAAGVQPAPVSPKEDTPSEEEDTDFELFQRMLSQTPPEEHAELYVSFQKLREKKLRESLSKRFEEVEARTQAERQQATALNQLRQNIDAGLRAADQRGGMEAAVAREFINRGDYARLFAGRIQEGTSNLARVLVASPTNVLSTVGMSVAIKAAAGWVQDGYQQMQSNPPEGDNGADRTSNTTARTTAMPARASREKQPKQKKTHEEKYADAVVSAGDDLGKALPFMSG